MLLSSDRIFKLASLKAGQYQQRRLTSEQILARFGNHLRYKEALPANPGAVSRKVE